MNNYNTYNIYADILKNFTLLGILEASYLKGSYEIQLEVYGYVIKLETNKINC